MGFFDEHESKKSELARQVIPEWFAPPARLIGKPLGKTLVLVQNADCAVVLTRFVAYPNGLDWNITVRFASHVPAIRHQTAWEGPDRAKFGVRWADGTAVFPYQPDVWPPTGRPTGPVLNQHGGQGDDGGITFGLWLNPLPSDPFHVIFAWKAGGIDETEAEVNIANLAVEASEALILWPADS